jgi:hypothetical protein
MRSSKKSRGRKRILVGLPVLLNKDSFYMGKLLKFVSGNINTVYVVVYRAKSADSVAS